MPDDDEMKQSQFITLRTKVLMATSSFHHLDERK